MCVEAVWPPLYPHTLSAAGRLRGSRANVPGLPAVRESCREALAEEPWPIEYVETTEMNFRRHFRLAMLALVPAAAICSGFVAALAQSPTPAAPPAPGASAPGASAPPAPT